MKLISSKKIPELKGRNKKEALDLIREHLVDLLSKGKAMDKAVELALDAMSLLFVFNKDYQKNLRGFKASYAFKTEDGSVDVSAVFKSPRFLFWHFPSMQVRPTAVPNPTASVEFSSGRKMAEFILSENPDVFLGLLENTLNFSGNINYILKFAYLARHIPSMLKIEPLR